MAFEARPRPSPAEYFKATNLVGRVEACLNQCYDAQPSNPLRFVADRLRDGCESGLVDETECSLRLDGCGGTCFRTKLTLSNGVCESVAVRLTSTPPHPTTIRMTVPMPKMNGSNIASRTAAADTVNGTLQGFNGIGVASQGMVDRKLSELDGTENFASIGSAIATGLSLAACVAGARLAHEQAFMRVAALADVHGAGTIVPSLPVVSLFGCGESRHFGRLRVVEFCYVPPPTISANAALRHAARLYEVLGPKCDEPNAVNVDGTLRHVSSDSLLAAVDMIEDAMREEGLNPGNDAFIGIVCDAAWCFKQETKKYSISDTLGEVSGAQLAEMLAGVCRDRPSVTYIEDSHHPSDKGEARRLMSRVGSTVSLCAMNNVGGSASAAIDVVNGKEANTIGIKLDDVGTVTGAIAVAKSRVSHAGTAVAASAGALASPSVADFAVGCGARFLRAGGLGRGPAAEIYNRLADIDEALRRIGMYSSPSTAPHADCVLPDPPAEQVVEVQATDKKKKK
uniref:phosphopyruvate hydratase n=1 Tax=Neobodo designis TaxID=312471 RepID=A0A7S1QII9_NEODS|mmetsp:Transcript_46371/g.143089  ORF Transcript_46371/g.143089 Transcript_46371/m.143089 type:complete len:511 (+) Transcript_46371:43-1575(+)